MVTIGFFFFLYIEEIGGIIQTSNLLKLMYIFKELDRILRGD